MDKVNIVATSDLHGQLPRITPCDLLIIAGDVCPLWDHSVGYQLAWLDTTFREWLGDAPCARIVGIAGNHDFVFEKMPRQVEELCLPWTYLQDQATEINGIKLYGLPWVPNLSRWAFHLDDAGLDHVYDAIPDDTDIVVSHGPPMGYGDLTCPLHGTQHAGADQANHMLQRVKPKLFISGHIHEAYGQYKHPSGTEIINVSHVNEDYNPYNLPMRIEWP
jgi:Icc-related predicted phosphoesterase